MKINEMTTAQELKEVKRILKVAMQIAGMNQVKKHGGEVDEKLLSQLEQWMEIMNCKTNEYLSDTSSLILDENGRIKRKEFYKN
jgi:hypothetical protein